MGSSEPPVGYLFADIEGSTERWEKAHAQMEVAVARLDSLIEEIVARNGGVIQDRSGDGVFVLFKLGNPLQCALEMQLEMQRTDWSAVGGLDVRIGVHATRANAAAQVDRAVANRGARITASGWGGQVVVSRDAREMYETPARAELIDLGLCRFKGVREAMHLSSLVHPDLLRSAFPPLRSLMFDGAGADALSSPIIGRAREFGDVLARLGATRMLTITGPGGNGKTRLALQVAAEVTSRQPVCFASLEGVGRDANLAATLAIALRLQLAAGRAADDQLISYLREKQMLLVLDNAETIATRAGLIAELVAACPQLTVLITSREPLGAQGEVTMRLGGLDLLDDQGRLSLASPALQYFLHEAQLKDPAFTVADVQLAVFSDLHRKVDGSPLALRLIAQWTKLLSLGEILERLEHSIDFLSPSAQSGQSLRGVFEGSWKLLLPPQQRSFARLSVFVKAFDLKAAAYVAGAELVTFLTLERKGLIVRAHNGRFAMHPMVREYAGERLAENAAEEAAAIRKHSEFYLEAVCACMENVQSPSRAAAGEQLRQDVPEIRAAWARAVNGKSKALVQRALEPLCYFLYTRSMFRDAVDIFNVAPDSAALRRHVAGIRANFLVHQGDAEGAAAAATSALAAPGGSQLARAHANHALGNLAHMRGDLKQATARYERAISIREKVGDLRGSCYASISLAALHLLFAHVDTAREHIKTGYRLSRQVGDAFGMMVSHLYAGDLAAVEQRLKDAQTNYEMALSLEEAVPHPQFRAMLHRRLGTLFVMRGDPVSALAHHQQGHDLSRDVGDQRTRAHALIEIGADLRLMGDYPNAKSSLLRGVRLSMTLGMQPALRRGLLELAHVDFALGNTEAVYRSVRVLERAELGELQPAFDGLVAQLEGGGPADVTPTTIQELLSELIEEAEVDTLKL